MGRRKTYEEIHLLPNLVAETVCGEVYTGQEWSPQVRSSYDAEKIEALRLKMTPDQVREFSDLCDERCRQAYNAKAKWFEKIVKSKDGRPQLMVWLRHWMASYLKNPEHLRRTIQTPA